MRSLRMRISVCGGSTGAIGPSDVARGKAAEGVVDHLLHVRGVDVADHDERHVVGRVEAVEEVEDALAGETFDRLFGADDRPSIRMHGERGLEQGFEHATAGRVFTPLPFFEHDAELLVELARIERRVLHRVGEHVEAGVGEARSHDDVVDGLVPRRPRVDATAGGLDLRGNFPDAALFRALEQHVLVDVGHAGLDLALVGAAGADPDLQGRDRGEVVLANQHGEPVRQLVEGRGRIRGLRGRMGRGLHK